MQKEFKKKANNLYIILINANTLKIFIIIEKKILC